MPMNSDSGDDQSDELIESIRFHVQAREEHRSRGLELREQIDTLLGHLKTEHQNLNTELIQEVQDRVEDLATERDYHYDAFQTADRQVRGLAAKSRDSSQTEGELRALLDGLVAGREGADSAFLSEVGLKNHPEEDPQ